jgi:7-carboxy-7-deazaguanine synthase
MRIAEIFQSIQGEGLLTGTESVFVRAAGCNLRCWFCDTPYASWQPEGQDLSVDEIVNEVQRLQSDHVVLTGGEPMLFAELIPLSQKLHRMGRHVTVETAGTLYLPVECDLMSISPKLSNSTPTPKKKGTGAVLSEPGNDRPSSQRWSIRHDRSRHVPDVIRRLANEYEYQIKFVIDCPEDCQEVHQYLTELPEIDHGRVLLMPQGTEAAELAEKGTWLEPYCARHGFEYCPRRQIEWFGLARGT